MFVLLRDDGRRIGLADSADEPLGVSARVWLAMAAGVCVPAGGTLADVLPLDGVVED